MLISDTFVAETPNYRKHGNYNEKFHKGGLLLKNRVK